MIHDPESWLGLRSERAAGGGPAATPTARSLPYRREPAAVGRFSWPAIRSVFHRTIGLMLGR